MAHDLRPTARAVVNTALTDQSHGLYLCFVAKAFTPHLGKTPKVVCLRFVKNARLRTISLLICQRLFAHGVLDGDRV